MKLRTTKRIFAAEKSPTGMHSGGAETEVDFLDLPLRSRSRPTTLFTEIKVELKSKYLLKELRLQASSWYDVSLIDFISIPKEHHLEIIEGKSSSNNR